MTKQLTEDQRNKKAKYAKTYYEKHRQRIAEHQRKLRAKTADPSKPIKQRAPKRMGLNRYWGEEEEGYVEWFVWFQHNQQLKDLIWNQKLAKPFAKLVENIFNVFKFCYTEGGPEQTLKECVVHLAMNLTKFDPSKGSKAFSYFSIVAKNYLIALNNANYRRFNLQDSIHEIGDQFGDDTRLPCELTQADKERSDFQPAEFLRMLIEWFDLNLPRIFPKQRDFTIAASVVELLRHCDRMENFNKKALYLMIREISNCKTQNISRVITKLEKHYRALLKQYVNFGCINLETSPAAAAVLREEGSRLSAADEQLRQNVRVSRLFFGSEGILAPEFEVHALKANSRAENLCGPSAKAKTRTDLLDP